MKQGKERALGEAELDRAWKNKGLAQENLERWRKAALARNPKPFLSSGRPASQSIENSMLELVKELLQNQKAADLSLERAIAEAFVSEKDEGQVEEPRQSPPTRISSVRVIVLED